MADFNSGIQPDQQRPMYQQPTPVDTTTASAISSAGSILGTVGGTLVQGAALAQQAEATKQQNSFLMNYSQDLLRISDLEQQGVLKPDQALRQYRTRTASMLANHPNFQDEIYKTYGNVVEKAGLGKNVVDDFEQQKKDASALKNAQVLAASQDGFIQPGMTPEQQDAMVDKHQQFLFGNTQMEQANKILANEKAKVELTNAKLGTIQAQQSIATGAINQQRAKIQLAQDKAKYQFTAGAQQTMDGFFSRFQNDMAQLKSQVGTQVQDPNKPKGVTMMYTQAMAVQDIDNKLANIQQQVSTSAAASGNQDAINALTHPLSMLADATKNVINGNTDKVINDNNVSNALAVAQHQQLTSDPEALTLVATSKLFPQTASSLQEAMGKKFTDLMKRNGLMKADGSANDGKPSDPTTNGDPEHDRGNKQYWTTLKDGISKASSGALPKDAQLDLNNHITKSLEGMGIYGPTAASAKELNNVVGFFSDKQVGKYLIKNPDIISGPAAGQAREAFKRDYQQVVLPLLQQEFLNGRVAVDNRSTVSGKGIRVSDPTMGESPQFIHPEFNGSGVTFVANDPTKGETNREAQRLNREVAPVMNTLIAAGAHFDGNQDYRTSYEKLMSTLDIKNQVPVNAPEPTANPKNAPAASSSSAGASDLEHMSHAQLLLMRDKLAPDDPRQAEIAKYEHQAFAREWVKENPALATASLAAAIPAYTAGKATGLVKSRTPASLDEMTAAFKGIGQGLGIVD